MSYNSIKDMDEGTIAALAGLARMYAARNKALVEELTEEERIDRFGGEVVKRDKQGRPLFIAVRTEGGE